ncbi:hypothetical protein SISNIDRAFT_492029, partial [Sistotremastrum niveocremeum HHB9708]
MSTPPPLAQSDVEDTAKTDNSTYRNPVPAFTSKPALDIHDTPLFHQLIGIIQEQNVTAKEQREILKGVKKVMERLEEKIDCRSMERSVGRRKHRRQPGDSNSVETESHSESGQEPTAEPPTNPMHEAIQKLSAVTETVKDTLGNMKDTLLDHGKKFDVLIKDAIKDDQPYDEKKLDDESTCTALFEMAMTKTKEEVDEWIKRMDVSLVFIALFSAVLTAFIVPATQNLFPSSNNTPGNPAGPPPLVPKISAQNVCVSYYLSLIVAIVDAVLSVLGRQWMSKLTNRPEGNTYKERLLRHVERERLAKPYLRLLVEGLNGLLLLSIGLFVYGLLSQIWNLSGSFEEVAPRLLATWVLGLLLSLGILGVVLGANAHALVYEASPFGGPSSRLLFRSAGRMAKYYEPWMVRVGRLANGLDGTYQNRVWAFRRIVPFVGRVIASPLWLSSLLVANWRVGLELNDKKKLLTTYMDLIAEASDPKLLERAVASFSYVEWLKGGGQSQESVDRLKKTWNRLTATDTSVRVRETLRVRIAPFVKFCADYHMKINGGVMQSIISTYHTPTRLQAEVYYASFADNNADLRPLAALPFEECIARVLCSYTHKGKLGDRERIFDLAEEHCKDLLQEGKVDDVTRILSHVNRLDLTKSFIQYPHYIYHPSVVEFIVKDHWHELLSGINQFVKTVDQSRLSPLSLSYIFYVLASPPPTDIDLSPLIDYFSRHADCYTWEDTTSDTIFGYLDSFGVSQFSDSTAVRRFLEQYVNTEFRDEDGDKYPTSDETRARAGELLAELNWLSSPPTGAIASTSIQPASTSHSPSHAPPLNDTSEIDTLSSSADSLAPKPENFDVDAVPSVDSRSDIPLTPLNHPPPTLPSSESTSNPSLSP